MRLRIEQLPDRLTPAVVYGPGWPSFSDPSHPDTVRRSAPDEVTIDPPLPAGFIRNFGVAAADQRRVESDLAKFPPAVLETVGRAGSGLDIVPHYISESPAHVDLSADHTTYDGRTAYDLPSVGGAVGIPAVLVVNKVAPALEEHYADNEIWFAFAAAVRYPENSPEWVGLAAADGQAGNPTEWFANCGTAIVLGLPVSDAVRAFFARYV